MTIKRSNFEVSIGRTVRQYTRVIVEAADAALAEARVQTILDSPGTEDHNRLLSQASWEDGDVDETEGVVDVQDALPCQVADWTYDGKELE